ncbi:MAG TPA: hypothetical protein VLH75_18875 [Longimicrobiales bacterium]|nr:hypothetical protein [Longimicrobiales bacterium]
MLPRSPRPVAIPHLVLGTTLFASVGLGGCLQSDQALPFELEEGATASRTIGPLGGTISLSSGIAIVFPVGALKNGTQITLTPRLDAAFPGDAGSIIPGTVFDVAPAGIQLAVPARVSLRLPVKGLPAADAVRLGVAQASAGRANLVGSGSYDGTSGLLSASLLMLGPVAAVLSDDAIPVGTGLPPTLGGGTFGGASPVGAWRAGAWGAGEPAGDGPLLADAGQRFDASCRPEARRCFSSGMVQVWASKALLDRLGGTLVILSPRLEADLVFSGMDANGLPTQALGSLSLKGTLRAQLGGGVSSYEVDESFRTGAGSDVPVATGVRFASNNLILSRTSDGDNRTMQYGLSPIGTGRLLTLRVEEEVEMENDDGSTTKGTVILFARLRG